MDTLNTQQEFSLWRTLLKNISMIVSNMYYSRFHFRKAVYAIRKTRSSFLFPHNESIAKLSTLKVHRHGHVVHNCPTLLSIRLNRKVERFVHIASVIIHNIVMHCSYMFTRNRFYWPSQQCRHRRQQGPLVRNNVKCFVLDLEYWIVFWVCFDFVPKALQRNHRSWMQRVSSYIVFVVCFFQIDVSRDESAFGMNFFYEFPRGLKNVLSDLQNGVKLHLVYKYNIKIHFVFKISHSVVHITNEKQSEKKNT